MKAFVLISLSLIQFDGVAQKNNTSDYNTIVSEVQGDLNNDKLSDKVIVRLNTFDKKKPYIVQIYFKQPDGEYNLITSSTKVIEPQYPDGNKINHNSNFSGLKIKNGVLIIETELLRGYYEHKFRFQNNRFELIGFYLASSDGLENTTTIDFNLSTGIRIEKIQNFENDKIVGYSKRKISLKALPTIQEVVPLQNGLY